MSRLSVLFADDFEEVSKRFCEFSDVGFDYRTCEKDGSVVLEELVKNPVDVVVMDFFMKGIDALGVLERFNNLNPLITPAVIVLSSVDSSAIKNEFFRKGADFYFNKPVKAEVLISKIKEIEHKKALNNLPSNSTAYFYNSDRIVTSFLHELCIPTHVKGYNYLRSCIKMSVENPQVLSPITSKLYPMVAEKCSVSSIRVERNIRNAIELAWDRGNKEAFSKYFGYNAHTSKKRPTNTEFIARISDEIRIRYNVS